MFPLHQENISSYVLLVTQTNGWEILKRPECFLQCIYYIVELEGAGIQGQNEPEDGELVGGTWEGLGKC